MSSPHGKKYTVSSQLVLLRSLSSANPVFPYSQLSDVELCAMVSQADHRSCARAELLRRHACLLAAHVVRSHSRGMGGADVGDYESLAVVVALQAYDDFDATKASSPSSYVFGVVLRRLLDAQQRTSLESDCRWPLRKLNFRHWLNGDYDRYPEFRERFEQENGVTPADRAELRLLHSHLTSSTWTGSISLDSLSAGNTSCRSGLVDSGAESSDVIINRVVLRDAIASLQDDSDRHVMHLFAVEDLSSIEISKELKMPLPEVRKRIRRVRNHLISALA